MASISNLNVWKPRPGKLHEFMAVVAKAKRIHQRLGAKVRVWNAQFGGTPLSVGYVIEHAGWREFGEFRAELEVDAEWQALVAEWASNSSAPAELVQDGVFVEVAVA